MAKKTTKKKLSKKPTATKAKVSLGRSVPDFSLDVSGDKTFQLKDYAGKKLVIFFYPKDMTPGCTVEGRDFSALKAKFKKLNTEVFGISRDSVKSHDKFIAKEGYKIDLLSDPDEKACKIFGVMKKKKLYGREYIGIDRSTFVIDEKGKLVREWRGVKVPGHAEAVLEFVKSN